MIIYILIAVVVSILIGGFFAIKFKDKLHLILGFSAGAILGVALFDLLPEVIELTEGYYDLLIVMSLVAFGFSLFMLIDRFYSLHSHSEDGNDCKNPIHNGQIKASAIIIHSMLDGLSIGLAFKISPTVGGVLAFAVLVHGFSDGINTVNMVMKKGYQNQALKWLALNAIAPTIGVVLALIINVPGPILGLILSVFIGIFLYISASDLIPESHHRHPAIWTTILTLVGVVLIFIASYLI